MMTDIVEKPKPYQIADSLLEMAQDVEIGHADRLGVPAASFLRESADCISRQNDEIERLRADNERLRAALRKASDEIEMLRRVENDAAEWVEERTKRMRADNERLRAALIDINDAFEELSNADVDQSVKELARGVIQRANRWQES